MSNLSFKLISLEILQFESTQINHPVILLDLKQFAIVNAYLWEKDGSHSYFIFLGLFETR